MIVPLLLLRHDIKGSSFSELQSVNAAAASERIACILVEQFKKKINVSMDIRCENEKKNFEKTWTHC